MAAWMESYEMQIENRAGQNLSSQAAVFGKGCDLTVWSLKRVSIYEAKAK